MGLEGEVPPGVGTEAEAEAIPSWDAAVGTEMNCRSVLKEATFAVSMIFPPPTATRNLASFASSSASAMDAGLISSARKVRVS